MSRDERPGPAGSARPVPNGSPLSSSKSSADDVERLKIVPTFMQGIKPPSEGELDQSKDAPPGVAAGGEP